MREAKRDVDGSQAPLLPRIEASQLDHASSHERCVHTQRDTR